MKRAEEDIANFENKGQSSHGKQRYHPYERLDRKTDKKPDRLAGKTLVIKVRARNPIIGHLTSLPDQPWASSRKNDNYCVNKLQGRQLAGSIRHSDTTDSTFLL